MSYETLLRTLDAIRNEAPKSFTSYHPKQDDTEKLNQARAKAFIHLFLKVRFGISDFSKRHEYICDGSQDGVIDGYHIDTESRKVTLIQSKFRTTERNFQEKSIEVNELLKMEVGRVSRGVKIDSNGVEFSARISSFQKKISEIRDIALYDWQVVLLANLKGVNDEQIRQLLDNMEYETFDHPRTYDELVFPLTTGTNFTPSDITIKINLGKKQSPQLNHDIETSLGVCNVRMLYVPTIEIARFTSKYRNALLRYNPRNYLSLSRNEVNQSIRDTIKNTTKNEFSLRNNGITILAEYSSVTDRTGVSGEGQLIIKDPQILNGGQTATTLAMMLDDPDIGIAAFEPKEVLLEIIERPKDRSEGDLADFIEAISDATNKQSKIVEADRRANDPKLISLQSYFYKNFGLFLERKRGEFQYGLDEKCISKTDQIDRVTMARALTAYSGDPPRARSSQDRIFEEEGFDMLLIATTNLHVALAFFSLGEIEAQSFPDTHSIKPQSIRYGKYAMLMAISKTPIGKISTPQEIKTQAAKSAAAVGSQWNLFEKYISEQQSNHRYNQPGGFNFDGYYKGSTVSSDLSIFKW